MGVCAADMSLCNVKKRCTVGPNLGVAYDPQNPCCGLGEFDEATCDCVILNGWLYVLETAVGFCYEFSSGPNPPTVCPNSTIVSYAASYLGSYDIGGELPPVAWETSLDWVVLSEGAESTEGYLDFGESVTAEIKESLGSTSDNTAWELPISSVGVSSDISACTLPFTACGAVRLDDLSANSSLFYTVLPYPEDKDEYCSGLDDAECFLKAFNDYGAGGDS
jgi:hypothetical protein